MVAGPVFGEIGIFIGVTCVGGNRDHRVRLAPATSTAYVSMLSGGLGSFADYVTGEDPPAAAAERVFHLANSQCRSNHGAAVTSFFAGVSGPDTFPSLAVGAGVLILRAVTGGSHVAEMTRAGDGICGFTGFGGRWERHLEGAWIAPEAIGGVRVLDPLGERRRQRRGPGRGQMHQLRPARRHRLPD